MLLSRAVAPSAFRKVGFRRIALGFGGVALATLGLAFFEAFTLGRSKVAQGHIPADAFLGWVGSSTLYLFVLMFIFTLALTSLLVAPMTIWFANRNKATLPAVVMVGVIVALFVAALMAFFPANDWARAHPLRAFWEFLSSTGVGAILVSLAFGLGARLPVRQAVGENAT
jgi:hypothetical protein